MVPATEYASAGEAETYFDLFGLPCRYALELDELERRYREASRKWHPDRFGRAPAQERVKVLKRATDFNEAYRVLKSDARRAEYLLKLQGIDLGAEESGRQPAMDPEFLDEVLELREMLLLARAARDELKLSALRAHVAEHMTRLFRELERDFLHLEAGDKAVLTRLAKTLLAQRYYQRFLGEIDLAEESALAEPAAKAGAR